MGIRRFLTLVVTTFVAFAAASELNAQSGEPNTQDIVITSGSASPSVVQVPAGASIRWINMDAKSHELVLEFSDGFELPLITLEPGSDFTMAFTDSEALLFRSLSDPGVSGSITVGTATPVSTPTLSTGGMVRSATAVATSPAAAATPTGPATSAPRPAGTVNAPAIAGAPRQPVEATTSAATPPRTPIGSTPVATPPPPAAGGLGLAADRDSGGVYWLGILGAALMLFAVSGLLFSGSKKRITFERRK